MIKKVLEEREATHGDYEGVAATAQEVKDAIHIGPNYYDLCPVQKESLDMIASKIARIVNGNPLHEDHWLDIIGYAQLAIDDIKSGKKKK